MLGFHNTKEITGYYSGTETDRMPYIAISDNSTTTPVTIVEHENGEKWAKGQRLTVLMFRTAQLPLRAKPSLMPA